MGNEPLRRRWETWEDEVIREHYPYMDVDELAKLLPSYRTGNRIRYRAQTLGVRRQCRSVSPRRIARKREGESILLAFYRYMATAKRISLQAEIVPNVDYLIQTFRDVYGQMNWN